jgi:3-isopropylmalate/(R)-2-methylmalate dehydratase small subunit
MQAFRTHTETVAVLDRANIDTDQIIPKQFLKRIERTGYGEFLFYDWRFDADGAPHPAFALNQPQFQGASILVAGKNFGCGSSREHAAWALLQYGFRAIVAPSFADIFANNALKNGLLTVVLSEAEVAAILARASSTRTYLTIDLETCTVTGDEFQAKFTMNDFARHCLRNGLDDIALTLAHEPDIARFEQSRPRWMPSISGEAFAR